MATAEDGEHSETLQPIHAFRQQFIKNKTNSQSKQLQQLQSSNMKYKHIFASQPKMEFTPVPPTSQLALYSITSSNNGKTKNNKRLQL